MNKYFLQRIWVHVPREIFSLPVYSSEEVFCLNKTTSDHTFMFWKMLSDLEVKMSPVKGLG